MVLSFVDRLGSDPAYADRIDGLEARPPGASRARRSRAQHLVERALFIERSASGETQVLQQHLARMFVAAGEALAGDSELRAEINKGLVAVLGSFIADQKSGVSSFISDQVKAWDMGQLISLIEINIGKDLQYIRFNGSLIGGLAGLGALHRRIPAALAVTFTSLPGRFKCGRLLSPASVSTGLNAGISVPSLIHDDCCVAERFYEVCVFP